MARITRLELARSPSTRPTPESDFLGEANPDEIKAHVVLTPVVAHPTEADSNIRRLSIT